VLKFKTGFQELEKVLKLAEICIEYWKSMEIPNEKEIWSVGAKFCWRQSSSLLIQCYEMWKIEFQD